LKKQNTVSAFRSPGRQLYLKRRNKISRLSFYDESTASQPTKSLVSKNVYFSVQGNSNWWRQ